MTSLFEPDPLLLAFLAYKKFVYLEVLAVLALLRALLGRGLSRWPALVAFGLAAAGTATTFAPAAGISGGPLYAAAARTMAGGGGMAALLVPSAVFLLSSVTSRARWRWMDALHGLMLAVLLGLWWWSA